LRDNITVEFSKLTISDSLKYPFLPMARNYIASLGLDFDTIASLQEIRDRAKQRVSSTRFSSEDDFSIKSGRYYEVETASYALAILYLAGIAEPILTEKFALFEAQKVNAHLRQENNSKILFEIAKAFNWIVEKKGDFLFVHFAKFLETSTRGRLHHNSKWKLVNRIMEKGLVQVSPRELARLLQEDVKNQIEKSAKQELGNAPEQIQHDIDELKADFLKRKPQFESVVQAIRAQQSDYPPCIVALMKRATEGKHLSHVERFTLVTYLLRQGISVDTIVHMFSNVSDFKEDKTRYQVEHLSGVRMGKEPYMPYNCSSLQTHNVCPGASNPICRTIRNPLSYHLRKRGLPLVKKQKDRHNY
jgi:DNA primase large subunit